MSDSIKNISEVNVISDGMAIITCGRSYIVGPWTRNFESQMVFWFHFRFRFASISIKYCTRTSERASDPGRASRVFCEWWRVFPFVLWNGFSPFYGTHSGMVSWWCRIWQMVKSLQPFYYDNFGKNLRPKIMGTLRRRVCYCTAIVSLLNSSHYYDGMDIISK